MTLTTLLNNLEMALVWIIWLVKTSKAKSWTMAWFLMAMEPANATEKFSANGANPGSNCKSLLVDTVLAFIMHGLDTGTPANVQKIALTTFTVVEIRLAVKKLWEHCQFGEVPTKHTSRNRSEMSALLSMDSTDVPHLCCDFKGLSRIPKFGIEDVTDIALSERIRRLEVKLLQLEHTVCEHSESLLAPVTVTMVKKPPNNSKPQKSKTKNNINSQLPKSAIG